MRNSISVDLDGVMFDFVSHFCDHLNIAYDLGLDYLKIEEYYWWKQYPDILSKDMFEIEFDAYTKAEKYRDTPVMKKNVKVLRSLSEKYDLIFLSKRPLEAYSQSIEALELAGFENPTLIFTSTKKSKHLNIIRPLCHIDDSPYVAEDVLLNTRCPLIMIDWKYNRHVRGDYLRVKHLGECNGF